MTEISNALTIDDFHQLKQDSQPTSRAEIARKICYHIEQESYGGQNYELACEIALYLQKDKEIIVRKSLAENICGSEKASPDLIFKLAMDDRDEVALPVLSQSPIINDETLIAIMPAIEKVNRLVAIANRRFLSVTVSTMLAERKIEEVATALLSNDSAIIDEMVILQIAHHHPKSKNVLNKMMGRMPLPTSAVNHMVRMQQQAAGQLNKAPAEIKSFSSLDTDQLRDDIKRFKLLGASPSHKHCNVLIDQIEARHPVAATHLILMMCMGLKPLFIQAMSRNVNMPIDTIEAYLNAGAPQFSLLMNKSGVSASLYPLMHYVFEAMQNNFKQGVEPISQEFAENMVISMISAEKSKINFATTIGKPLSKALRLSYQHS